MTGLTAAPPRAVERRSETSIALRRRLAGAAFVVLAGQFMTVMMLAASIAPDYDFARGAISDLGVAPATALLFNASLALVGVLSIAGGWFLTSSPHRLAVLAVFVAAGVGAIGAAVFPLDRGGAHALFALTAFVCFNLEPLAVGLVSHGWTRLGSVLVGVVGLAFVGLMVVGDGGNAAAFGAINHGGAERMIVYPVMLWLLAFGGFLLGTDAER
jgi:hypothetical membrane protein